MTTSITDFLKISAAVVAVALAIFFGYSVTGYVSDTFSSVYANETGGGDCGGDCGTDWTPTWSWGGGVVGCSSELDGGGCGGGGGGGFTPYCTITVTQGAHVANSYPAQYQYVITWTAPGAASFSINNGIGSVTPPTSGTYTLTTATIPGTFIGTASTHKGIVTCRAPLPPENPPYCSIIASPSTIAHGGSSVITWNTTKGTSFSINNGVGSLTPVGGGTVTVSPSVTTTYTGTVVGPGGTAQCQTTIVVTDPPKCELEITKTLDHEDYKSFGAATVGPNENITYTIQVKNTGGAKCTGSGVKVQDVLDSRLTYISETHSSNITAGYQALPVYESSSRTVSFNAWDLDPSEMGWIKITAKTGIPTACSEVVPNKARVTSYEYNNFTTWVYSNIVNVTVAKDCTPPTECKLEITKVANKTTVAPNGTIEYTINFKNVGGAKCTGSGVKVQDVLHPYLDYVSETHSANVTAGYQSLPVYQSSNRTVSFNAWDLDPNESGWVKIVVKAGTPVACTQPTANYATITSFEYDNFNVRVESNIVHVTIEKDCTPPPTECKLEITKVADKTTVAAGGTIEYTINVKNSGTKKCTGSGVKIIDVLDSRLNYQSSTHSYNITAGYQLEPVYKSSTRTLSFNAWDLEPAETGWIKVVVTAGTPTTCSEVVPNTAKITAFEYNNFMTWVESAVSNVTVTKNCHVPVPYCTMSIDPTSVTSGGAATLTWNSTNVTSVTIDQGVGSVALSGSKVVNPTANTTYTGTFTGPGGTVTCQATVTIPSGPAPQCTLTASASKIKSGQSVIVSWTSQNVSSGNITSIGNASPVSAGSAEVFPADSTTFTGTFTGSYGTVTCSAPVTVEKGGGGCSGNCGGGLNQPNVVMLQKPPEAPLAFVTLDQMPYTGFEAGKALTLAFWISVGLLAAAITYFAMGHNALQMILGTATAPSPWNSYAELDEEVRDTTPHAVPNTLSEARRDSAAYSASVAAAPVYQYAAPVAAPVAQRPVVDGIPDLTDVIESRAHGAGVLMSPESVQLALELSKDRGEVLRQFGEILNEAVKVLPREDGWVMLTSERFADLAATVTMPVTRATPTSTPSVEAILNSVMPPAAPTAQPVAQPNVEMPMTNADDQSVVMSLARSILAGNRDQAFATLRNLEVSGAKAGSVMTVIAGAYDQLYRARRHGLTTELSGDALSVTDEALAQMTETFIHSMDQAYANPFTSLKLAIAQAFEVRG